MQKQKKLLCELNWNPSTGQWELISNNTRQVLFVIGDADDAIQFAGKWADLFITSEESLRKAKVNAILRYSEEILIAPSCFDTGLIGEKSFDIYRAIQLKKHYASLADKKPNL